MNGMGSWRRSWRRSWRNLVRQSLAVGVVGLSLATSGVAEAQSDARVGHVEAGEFGKARALAMPLDGPARNDRLTGIALGQARSGDALSASRSIGSIADPAEQSAAIAGVRGGGSLADFSQLMGLIQTTVAPETWDALGGPSTMFPYPNGIYVDAEGLIRESTFEAAGDALEQIQSLLRPHQDVATLDDWKQPAPLRCVSMRRVSQEWLRTRTTGTPLTESLYNLGGLSRIEYVMIDERHGDVVLAGPVGGIDTSTGWPRDRQTGAAVLQLPLLMAVIDSVRDRRPFGCTIDPTNEGIAKSLVVAKQIQQKEVPIHDAAAAMQTALGRQAVTVFGTSGDSPLGWMLVEADRHMKQLALGQQPMPQGVPNYLDVVTQHIADGPPNGQLLRLWFTAAPISIRADAARRTFQLSGRPLKLASEDQRPDAAGNRQVANMDIRSLRFTKAFNKDFDAIANAYPIYRSLESLYLAAGVAELMRQHMSPTAFDQVFGPLSEGLIGTGLMGWQAPRAVDSIAVMHSITHRGKRHHVIVASGGVIVEPAATIAGEVVTYDSLATVRPSETARPASVDQWWWNQRTTVDTGR